MRDYSAIVQRIENCEGKETVLRVLGEVAGYPVHAVRLSQDGTLPVVFINGGTHGDEPAGVEGVLAFLERSPGNWLDHFQFEVIPCLNPHGYVHGSRLNAMQVDINWAFLREDVPEIDLIKTFINGRRFEAVVDLHEDWESPGYYLYELVRNRPPAGSDITRRVAEVCPLNLNTTIEGERAVNGVVFPNMEVEKRRIEGGIPIALFQQAYTNHLITSETPTEAPMDQRVEAHQVALETILGGHAQGEG